MSKSIKHKLHCIFCGHHYSTMEHYGGEKEVDVCKQCYGDPPMVCFECFIKLENMPSTYDQPKSKVEQPHFCVQCGSQLNVEKKLRCYNHDTGKPEYEYHWVCPNHKWYNPHMKFVTDDNFSSYSYQDY